MEFSKIVCCFCWIALNICSICLSFRTRDYKVQAYKKIINNYLESFSDIESLIACSKKCTETDHCDAASYDKTTLLCRLHFDSTIPALISEHSDFVTSLIATDIRTPVELQFDIDYLHPSLYVSADKTRMSTQYSSNDLKWPVGVNALKSAEGAVTNRCIEKNQKFYFELHFYFHGTSLYSTWALLMEIGIADKASVDDDFHCGTTKVDGWSFIICKIHPNITLTAYRNGLPEIVIPLSIYKAGTYITGKFAVIANRINHVFSLFDKDTQSLIYSFNGVISNSSLCPVFRFFNNEYATNASISILNAYEINN